MGKLQHLERLVIAGNREISNPPPIILRQGTPGILSYMRRILKGIDTLHFDLSALGLTEMPPDICSEYTQLTELDLGDNKLVALPKAIESLTQMVKLRLDGNPIEALQVRSLLALLVQKYEH
jgi:Leucine-rich repeat (LRR) protein